MKREYIGIETPDGSYLEGWVETGEHGADLDGEFLIETDDGTFKVQGWNLSCSDIQTVEPPQA